MNPNRYLRSRIELSPWILGLAVGDLLAILVFLLVGMMNHGFDPVGDVDRLAWNLSAFGIGWMVAAPLAGVYRPDALSSLRRVSRVLPAWGLGALLGHGLRSIFPFPTAGSLVFLLVSLVFGGLALLGWRGTATLLARAMKTR